MGCQWQAACLPLQNCTRRVSTPFLLLSLTHAHTQTYMSGENKLEKVLQEYSLLNLMELPAMWLSRLTLVDVAGNNPWAQRLTGGKTSTVLIPEDLATREKEPPGIPMSMLCSCVSLAWSYRVRHVVFQRYVITWRSRVGVTWEPFVPWLGEAHGSTRPAIYTCLRR